MALATLSIDLEARLAKFEGDMGRAVRVAEQAANRINRGFAGVGAVFTGSLLATAAVEATRSLAQLLPNLVEGAAQYQDLEDKTGASALALAGFQTAADVAGVSVDQLAGFMVKLTGTLSKTDDESKGAGAALKALGLALKTFRDLAPEQQFETLAQRLATFQDGAAKTAVAVALLGKSGADALPFLKDLVEIGGAQSRITAEQIRLADESSKAYARARSELKQAAQLAALQALPAFTALTEEMAKVAAEALGLGTEAGKLGGNTGFRDFAQDGALALATLTESIVGIIQTLRALAGSVQVITADVTFAARFSRASPRELGDFLLRDTGPLQEAANERERVLSQANERYLDLINADGARVSSALRKQFDENNAAALVPQSLRDTRGAPGAELQTLVFKPAAEKDAAALAAQREAAQVQRAVMDQALKALAATFASERDLVTFQQQYLDAQQQQGLVSLQEYYGQRSDLQQRALDVELRRLDGERQALEAALRTTADPSDRVKIETDLAQVRAEADRAREGYARRAQLDLLQERQAYADLTDSVRAFAAQLLELQGDAAGAAGLRAQQTIDAARRSARALGLSDGQVQAFEDATRATLVLGNAQRDLQRINEQAADEEERFLLAARRRGASAQEVERGLFALRANSLAQLAELSARANVLADQARVQALAIGANPDDNPAVQFARQLRLEFERAADAVDPVRNQLMDLADDIGARWAGAIEDALLDGDWASAGEAILRDLTRGLLNETITKPLQDALSGVLKGGIGAPGTSPGSGLGTLVGGALGKLFGTAPAAAAQGTPGGADAPADLGADALKLLGRAAGDSAAQLAGLGKDSALVSQVMSLLPTAAVTPATTAMATFTIAGVQPATFSLAGLAVMADTAAAALATVAGTSVAGGLGDLGKLFGNDDVLGAFGFGSLFSEGGYTGSAPVTAPVGVVHGNEYVFSAPAVRALGVPALEQLHRSARAGAPRLGLPGYADGGFVVGRPRVVPQTAGAAPAARPPKVEVINRTSTPVRGTAEQTGDGGLRVFLDEIEGALGSRIANGGGLARPIGGRFALNSGAGLIV